MTGQRKARPIRLRATGADLTGPHWSSGHEDRFGYYLRCTAHPSIPR